VNRAALALVEKGLVPDWLTRRGIRSLLRQRLVDDVPSDVDARRAAIERMRAAMARAPVAVETEAANEQHYEVPAEFYEVVLGRHLKYSSCYYAKGDETLDEAEADMLQRTCERAGLKDGQDILELGCGWGSLTLWMAERYPSAAITSVSNSASQRHFIEQRAADRGLENVTILTHDMNTFEPPARYDRIVSVEMFEHMRNWSALLERAAGWLREDGRLFLHVFCHRSVPYFFEDHDAGDWMARHFFTGGLMPSLALPGEVTPALEVEEQWVVPGTHYERTARHWLERLDSRRAEVEEIFGRVYGPSQASRWIERWRVFFMACEELFGFADGQEWVVGHTRLRPADRAD
jgi:cyclopropane-fatty-acyl-phospholipid synthase